jgi:hypothetical protein
MSENYSGTDTGMREKWKCRVMGVHTMPALKLYSAVTHLMCYGTGAAIITALVVAHCTAR